MPCQQNIDKIIIISSLKGKSYNNKTLSKK